MGLEALFLATMLVQGKSCLPPGMWQSYLEDQHAEVTHVRLLKGRYMYVILVDPEDGSWTLLAEFPNRSCYLDGGNAGWQDVPIEEGDPS